MPFSLYRRLDLSKLTPTEIYLQMDDKYTTLPIGICEDVPIVVANVTIKVVRIATLVLESYDLTIQTSPSHSTIFLIECKFLRS